MKILYFGSYRKNYSRNKILIEGLRESGIEVIECNAVLWRGIDDRVKIVKGGWINPKFWKRFINCYLYLIRQYFQVPEYDVMVCGYPGHFDVYLGWILTRLHRKPLVWDVFMSIYLISLERNLKRKNEFTILLLWLIEYVGLRLPEKLIQDTNEYVEWLSQNYKINPSRFYLIPTGADDRVFYPITQKTAKNEKFTVLYYGSFIKNHGVDIIVKAAKILLNTNIKMILIGDGPEREGCEVFVKENKLNNVFFVNWIPQEELVVNIAEADLCLGVFGNTFQSKMTVQNKIFECLAMKRPIVTGDSVTVRSFFIHGEHLHICDRNPSSLAKAIIQLSLDSSYCNKIAEKGFDLFNEKFTRKKLGFQFKCHLFSVLN